MSANVATDAAASVSPPVLTTVTRAATSCSDDVSDTAAPSTCSSSKGRGEATRASAGSARQSASSTCRRLRAECASNEQSAHAAMTAARTTDTSAFVATLSSQFWVTETSAPSTSPVKLVRTSATLTSGRGNCIAMTALTEYDDGGNEGGEAGEGGGDGAFMVNAYGTPTNR